MTDTFLTPEQLDIPVEGFNSLTTVLEGLETGALVHIPDYDDHWPKNGFNMNIWLDSKGCGTIGCIAGWAEKLTGFDWIKYFRVKYDSVASGAAIQSEIGRLFYAHGMSTADMDAITPAQAAVALRRYLTTGKGGWEGIQ